MFYFQKNIFHSENFANAETAKADWRQQNSADKKWREQYGPQTLKGTSQLANNSQNDHAPWQKCIQKYSKIYQNQPKYIMLQFK